MGDRNAPEELETRSPSTEIETMEVPIEASATTAIPVPAEPEPISSKISRFLQERTSPNSLRLVLQLISVLAFCGLLVPYMQYSRAKKATKHEICRRDARSLYEKNLAHCDVKAATSLAGGALGLNWLEMAMVLVLAAAWQYAVWLFQGWMIIRTSFLEKDHDE